MPVTLECIHWREKKQKNPKRCLVNFVVVVCLSHVGECVEVDRALKLLIFETMNLSETTRRNVIKRAAQNVIIPWDDPYPSISSTLSEEQQLFLKTLNFADVKSGI